MLLTGAQRWGMLAAARGGLPSRFGCAASGARPWGGEGRERAQSQHPLSGRSPVKHAEKSGLERVQQREEATHGPASPKELLPRRVGGARAGGPPAGGAGGGPSPAQGE